MKGDIGVMVAQFAAIIRQEASVPRSSRESAAWARSLVEEIARRTVNIVSMSDAVSVLEDLDWEAQATRRLTSAFPPWGTPKPLPKDPVEKA